jgi:eukaryotic-like serine/threonine-protein kinase
VIFGEYNIEGVLGRGSAGTVHLARRISNGTEVALKRLPNLASDDEKEHLLAEGRALARLDHPNILKLIEIVDDNGELAVVTELAQGGTLSDLIRTRGPMKPDEVVALLAPIADALAHAHTRGVLHRDVKPSNILLRKDGTPVLGDFGLALDDVRTSQTTQTALGSAAYLDPDVLDGQPPSAASDGYALGVVAFECLTGELPFAGDSTFSVLRNADRGDFMPLDRVVVGPLADHIERAFSRHRSDRFPSMGALALAWRNPTEHQVPVVVSSVLPARFDDEARATTKFNVAHRPVALSEATPVAPMRPWKKMAGVAAGVILLGGAATGVTLARSSSDSTGPSGLVGVKTNCDPARTPQCVASFIRNPQGIRVTFAGDASPTQYVVGQRDDTLRVGNFFCGDAETLAIYRPSTGVVYYFKNWPLNGEQTDALADSTGILNGEIGVSDIDGDGCADIALDKDGKRTWFTPVSQPKRLQQVTQSLTPTNP